MAIIFDKILGVLRQKDEGISSAGTEDYIPLFGAAGASLTDSILFQNTTGVGVGTNTPTAKIETRANGSTSATYSYLAKSATGVDLLRLDDSGRLYLGHLGSSIYTDAVESPSSLVIYGRDKTIFDSRFTSAVLGAKIGKELSFHAWTGFGTSNIRFQAFSAGGGGTIITEDISTGEVGFKSSFFSGGFEHRFVNGNIIIGANEAPTEKLDIVSDIIRLRTSKTPTSATDNGKQGNICWDNNYIYICVATNTWKRATINTW